MMGYCDGGDLCSRLKRCNGQLLPEVQIVEWFVQISLALQVSTTHKAKQEYNGSYTVVSS